MVELALVAPILFVLILGTIEAGRFMLFYEVMNNATREGARYAIVHGADSTCPRNPSRSSGSTSGSSFVCHGRNVTVVAAGADLSNLSSTGSCRDLWIGS